MSQIKLGKHTTRQTDSYEHPVTVVCSCWGVRKTTELEKILKFFPKYQKKKYIHTLGIHHIHSHNHWRGKWHLKDKTNTVHSPYRKLRFMFCSSSSRQVLEYRVLFSFTFFYFLSFFYGSVWNFFYKIALSCFDGCRW